MDEEKGLSSLVSEGDSLQQDDHTRSLSNGKIEYRYLDWTVDDATLLSISSQSQCVVKQKQPRPPDLSKTTNPMSWSGARKSVLVWLSCVGTALVSKASPDVI